MKVTLMPYQPGWREDFICHRRVIEQALSSLEPVVEHIGSTSLGDIVAKPIIDVLVGLPEDQSLDRVVEPLLDAGYTYIEQFNAGMPYRRFFAKLVPLQDRPPPRILGEGQVLAFGREYNSVANIHVLAWGSRHWTRHIAFRDYLRAHDQVRQSYAALKLKIAEMDFDDPLDYNAYKEDFIAECQEKALAWLARVSGPAALEDQAWISGGQGWRRHTTKEGG